MKLRETSLDHRLFAGLISAIAFIYGALVLDELSGKFHQFCGGSTATVEISVLVVYLVLATLGVGLGSLHLLSALKRRK